MDPNEVSSTIAQVVDASATLVSTWGLSVLGAIAVLVIGRWVASLMRCPSPPLRVAAARRRERA